MGRRSQEEKEAIEGQILSKLKAIEKKFNKKFSEIESSLKKIDESSRLTTEDQLFFGIVFALFIFFIQFPEFDLCTVFENFDLPIKPTRGILTTKMVLMLLLVISSGSRYLAALVKDDTKRNWCRVASVSFLMACFYFLAFDLTIRGLSTFLKSINVFLIFLAPVTLSVISIASGHLIERRWNRAYGHDIAIASFIWGLTGVTILIAYYIGMVVSLFIPISEFVAMIVLIGSVFATYLATKLSNSLNKQLKRIFNAHRKTYMYRNVFSKRKRDKLTTYRRRKEKDAWHWCTNCSNYPSNPDDVTVTKAGKERPSSGELCNECRAKEKAGTCET